MPNIHRVNIFHKDVFEIFHKDYSLTTTKKISHDYFDRVMVFVFLVHSTNIWPRQLQIKVSNTFPAGRTIFHILDKLSYCLDCSLASTISQYFCISSTVPKRQHLSAVLLRTHLSSTNVEKLRTFSLTLTLAVPHIFSLLFRLPEHGF